MYNQQGIKVFGGTLNRGIRIYWMLEELGLDYEGYDVKLFEGQQLKPSFLAINPGGKVPVLFDGDLKIIESGAILNHLSSKYGKDLLPASGTDARAIYDQWFCFCLTELEPPVWTASKHSYIYRTDRRVSAIIETSKFEFKRTCQRLSEQLGEQEYLLGAFSPIDILAGQILMWASLLLQFEVSNPNLIAYLNRLNQRPALIKANSLKLKDFET